MKTRSAWGVCALACGMMLAPRIAAGEERASGLISKGVFIGVNSARVSLDDDMGGAIDIQGKLGLVGGVFGVFALNYNLGLQIEVAYTQKGAKVELAEFGTATISVDYMQVPLLARVVVPVGGSTELILLGGPQLSINVAAESRFEGAGGSGTEDIKDQVESVEYGVIAGVGVSLPKRGGGGLAFGVRYDLGFSTVPKRDPADEFDFGTDFENRTVTLFAGYGF